MRERFSYQPAKNPILSGHNETLEHPTEAMIREMLLLDERITGLETQLTALQDYRKVWMISVCLAIMILGVAIAILVLAGLG